MQIFILNGGHGKRVKEFSKKCVDGKTGYLDNVLNMFLNVVNIFNNLLLVNE